MKICCIFNIAPSYRETLYRMMDEDLSMEVDFLTGENPSGGIAVMDARRLEGFRGYLRNVYRKSGKLVWQRGWRKAFGRRYDAYILTGNAGIRSNWIIALLARITGRKVYLWSHGLHGNESAGTLRKNMLYFRLASHILLYGERARDLLEAEGVPAGKMTVVYNSLNYFDQLEVREHMGDSSFVRNYFGNDRPYAAFVGRLIGGKKLDLLLESLRSCDCNLILVGDGPEREKLEKLAVQYGLADRVWFYGESYDEQFTGTVLYHAAICVSPGSIGLTAIHSLTYGTPVITHDNLLAQAPESEAVVEGATGSYFRENDFGSLADKITYYTLLSGDPASRSDLREECRKMVETKYNPLIQMEILRRLFGMEFVEQ